MTSHLLRLASKQLPHKIRNPLVAQLCANYHGRSRIGNREIVGYGINGSACYLDKVDFPMPAIRFKEDAGDVLSVREKEKGDWKKLTMDEKKTLYRASFCQTFAEMRAPTGEWKVIVAGVISAVSCALWVFMALKKFVYNPPPPSFSPEAKAAQLQRMIDLRVNPVEGLTSNYDYEKGRWKD